MCCACTTTPLQLAVQESLVQQVASKKRLHERRPYGFSFCCSCSTSNGTTSYGRGEHDDEMMRETATREKKERRPLHKTQSIVENIFHGTVYINFTTTHVSHRL